MMIPLIFPLFPLSAYFALCIYQQQILEIVSFSHIAHNSRILMHHIINDNGSLPNLTAQLNSCTCDHSDFAWVMCGFKKYRSHCSCVRLIICGCYSDSTMISPNWFSSVSTRHYLLMCGSSEMYVFTIILLRSWWLHNQSLILTF
jgi:hypothetical protein